MWSNFIKHNLFIANCCTITKCNHLKECNFLWFRLLFVDRTKTVLCSFTNSELRKEMWKDVHPIFNVAVGEGNTWHNETDYCIHSCRRFGKIGFCTKIHYTLTNINRDVRWVLQRKLYQFFFSPAPYVAVYVIIIKLFNIMFPPLGFQWRQLSWLKSDTDTKPGCAGLWRNYPK